MLFQFKNISDQAYLATIYFGEKCNIHICLQYVYHSYICFIIYMVYFIDLKLFDFIPRKNLLYQYALQFGPWFHSRLKMVRILLKKK